MTKLSPDERLIIESGTNHYQVVGPGRIWVKPWQRVLAELYIGPQGQALNFKDVRTVDNIPVEVTIQLLYQIDPTLFTGDLLPRLPKLNEGGWSGVLRWRIDYVLRRLMAAYAWRELGQETVQSRLERQLTQTLADYLKVIGLRVTSVCIVRIELPDTLQRTLIQVERDCIEPHGRALVLKEYADIFGADLSQAMPYIIQWELLNSLHKRGDVNFILTSTGLSLDQKPVSNGTPPAILQIPLPANGQS